MEDKDIDRAQRRDPHAVRRAANVTGTAPAASEPVGEEAAPQPPALPPSLPLAGRPLGARSSGGSSAKMKKLFGPFVAVAVILFKFKGFILLGLGKLKFLLVGVKFIPVILKTGGTMVLSIGAYAMFWGVWFAVGFVLLIFVHECGHLVAARRCGLKVGAPVFIPFMGAIIALKEAPKNAWIEAVVGIGGPLLGTVGALVSFGLFFVTGNPMFVALAYTGFFLNLFNLAPISPLDGGRVVTVISPWLWVAGLVIMLGMVIARPNFILFLILIVGAPRLFSLFKKKSDAEKRYFEVTPTQRVTMCAIYFGLAGFLWYGMHVCDVMLSEAGVLPE